MSEAPKTTCFENAWIWTGEGGNPVPGGVLVRGNTITAILMPGESAAAAAGADVVVNASGLLLMPPFVDGHVHSSMTLMRGTENSLPLELWSYYAINQGRAADDEAIRHAVLLTAIEMIRNGIGGYIDHLPRTASAQAALGAHFASGLRVGFAPFFADLRDEDILDIPLDRRVIERIAPSVPRPPDAVRATYRDLDSEIRAKSFGRITLLAGPNSPQRLSDEMWALWRELQDTHAIGSHTHLLETWPQARAARRRWPGGMIQALDAHGLLHDRLSVGHAIWLDPDEKELLAARRVTVSFNPLSNAMLGSGRKNIRHDLDAGLRIALGTDCSNTGGRHDPFEIMRHMLVSGRDPGSDFDGWLTPEEVMTAATRTGAGAIGGVATGVLRAGGPADILMLDVEAAGMAAAPPGLASVVAHADPRNVHSLMIDGRWVLREGVITALDEAAVLVEAKRHAAELRADAARRANDLKSLHRDYAEWQRSVFAPCGCPTCGQTGGQAGTIQIPSYKEE